jgi:hypothetical protein
VGGCGGASSAAAGSVGVLISSSLSLLASPPSLALLSSSWSPEFSCLTASWRSCVKSNAGFDVRTRGPSHDPNNFPDRVCRSAVSSEIVQGRVGVPSESELAVPWANPFFVVLKLRGLSVYVVE